MESDPHGKDPHQPGAKLDHGKVDIVRFVLAYFPDAIEAVAGVSEYGAKKYTEMGWASVPDGYQRYTAAMGRHVVASARGEQFDISGLDHDAQIAWNALARLQLKLKDKRDENWATAANHTPGPTIAVNGL